VVGREGDSSSRMLLSLMVRRVVRRRMRDVLCGVGSESRSRWAVS